MMGRQVRTESLFYYFRLEDQIPEDHLLRLIDRHVDLSFVRDRLKIFYSSTGRPSIDSEVLLRLLLVGYLYGFTSERRLLEEVRMTTSSTVIVSVRNPDMTESHGFSVALLFPPPPDLPNVMFDYVTYAVTNLPPHYKNPNSPAGNLAGTDNTPTTNPITNAGATLGRVLFYDKFLSANNTTSCGSCHQQRFGFSDPNPLSTGFQGGRTKRRATGLSNAKFYQRGHFFSDERAATLEEQVLQPIQNSIEMGNSLSTLIPQMAQTTYYPALFQAAFGTPDITPDRMSFALAQFIRSMVSYQSKFDQAFAAGTNGIPNFAAVFNASELHGQALFTSLGCAQCHTTGGHVSDTIHNVGLDAVTSDPVQVREGSRRRRCVMSPPEHGSCMTPVLGDWIS